MKIGWLLSGTHVTAALLGGGAFFAASWSTAGFVLPLIAIAVAWGLGVAATRRLQRALGNVERVAAGGNDLTETSTGLQDVDRLAERIRQFSRRWSEAAGSSRREVREVQQLLAAIDRRSTPSNLPSAPCVTGMPDAEGVPQESISIALRQLLGGIATSTDEGLQEIVGHSGEAERLAQSIAAAADQQREILSRTTTCVEQMSADFDVVSAGANSAQQSVGEARELSAAAGRALQGLQQDTGRLRLHVETAERKLRALGERSHEIGSILQMIGAISSRTDLLALNASIESYRADGQPGGVRQLGGNADSSSVPSGRGFSVVAEEVRKLAEQTAQATREVTVLIESIQQETQDSILAMAEQRAHVESEAEQVQAAGEQLARVSDACSRSSKHVDDVLRAAEHQLRLTQDLLTNVESLSGGARENRQRAADICWTLRTVREAARKMGDALGPLQRCSDRDRSSLPETQTNVNDADHSARRAELHREQPPMEISSESEPPLASVDAAISLVGKSLETS